MRATFLAMIAGAALAPTGAALHATGELFVTAYLVEDADFAYVTVYACASDSSDVRASLVWLPDARDSGVFLDMGDLQQRGVGSCGWWMDRVGFVFREGHAPPAECIRVDARLMVREPSGVRTPVATASDVACLPTIV
ncbi:MAG TPA: hypothetical protein VI997_08905 [Candidatus Thermoplasmatota archaeon]|nr:hypothetical protein [Candidatus Thermoplasmatota archaeon]